MKNIWFNQKLTVKKVFFFLKHYFKNGFIHKMNLLENKDVYFSLEQSEFKKNKFH